MKGRIPLKLFQTQCVHFFEQWNSQQAAPLPCDDWPVFGKNWMNGWMKEYRVSLAKPNKRFSIKYEDRVQRVREYILNIWRIRR